MRVPVREKEKTNMLQRQDVIEAIAKKADLPMAQVEQVLDCLWAVIGEALKKGQSVQITGYATFSIVDRKARVGRNPHTGESIKIPPRQVVKISAGSKLKRSIQPKK